jgi:hypothetical protein
VEGTLGGAFLFSKLQALAACTRQSVITIFIFFFVPFMGRQFKKERNLFHQFSRTAGDSDQMQTDQ